MNFSQEVNDHAVSKLAEKCKNLRYICLSGCIEISDTVLMALADYCLNLNTLEVAGCVLLTDSGFLNLTAVSFLKKSDFCRLNY